MKLFALLFGILNLSYAQNANTYFEKIRNNEAQLTAFFCSNAQRRRFAPSF
jgi:adenosine deaminase/adenosine deaminase CECR1